MSLITTIAILGTVDTHLSFIAKRIPQKYKVLLFDKDAVKLTQIFDQLLANNPFANIEQMNCATNASWEADVIILSGTCCLDELIIEKIKQVSTGKIVIIFNDEINGPLSPVDCLSLQQSLRHVKLVEVIGNINPSKQEIETELTLKGTDNAALETVDLLFSSAGFTTHYSLTPIL